MSQPETATPRFESVTPRLPVQDIETALTFYTQRLGFQLGWKWGEPVTHANVCRDIASFDLIRVPAERQGSAMAYVQVNGVDAYFAELRTRRVITGDLADRPYGMRDF